jgi:two-component system, cell cycle sensor histidine kinase and response regulator CckA
VRSYIAAILRREGFQIIEVDDGLEALDCVQRLGGEVDLLVTDIRMPRMDGISLARAVIEKYPKLPIIYISGYPFDFDEERSRRPNVACAFLAKPFARTVFLEAVRKCLETRTKAAGLD